MLWAVNDQVLPRLVGALAPAALAEDVEWRTDQISIIQIEQVHVFRLAFQCFALVLSITLVQFGNPKGIQSTLRRVAEPPSRNNLPNVSSEAAELRSQYHIMMVAIRPPAEVSELPAAIPRLSRPLEDAPGSLSGFLGT